MKWDRVLKQFNGRIKERHVGNLSGKDLEVKGVARATKSGSVMGLPTIK